jgi:hypothetical protein
MHIGLIQVTEKQLTLKVHRLMVRGPYSLHLRERIATIKMIGY